MQWPDCIPPDTMRARRAPVIVLLSRSAEVIPSWPQQIITSGANSVDNTVPSTPPALAGLFFCLASAEGAGLLFCPAAIQAYTSVYSVFCAKMQLYRPRHKTARRALQWRFRRLCPFNYHRYKTDTSGYNAACAKLERITTPQYLQHIPDTSATPRRCTGQQSRLIIIRYIRVQRNAPCYGSMPDGATHRRQCQPGGAVQQQGRGGRRGTIDGYCRISFRAFAQ